MPADDGLDYARMMQRALRSVVREAIGVAAEEGLPGGHHFYIGFDTRHPGVVMPDWLRAQYPDDMTIVLQHEYWDLAVAGDRFSVGMSFTNRAVELAIPFDAVLTFVDPHAEFGLKFDPHDPDEDEEDEDGRALDEALGIHSGAEGEETPEDEDDRPDPPGADVVSLDRFRKS